jgi:hypothetical protein
VGPSDVIIDFDPSKAPRDMSEIGVIANHAGEKIRVNQNGTFEIWDSSSDVVLSTSSLAELVAQFFSGSGSSIKIENVRHRDTLPVSHSSEFQFGEGIAFRTTSTGPAIDFHVLGVDISGHPVPTLTSLVLQLNNLGAQTSVFDTQLLLVKDKPVDLGRLINATGIVSIGFSPLLDFVADGAPAVDIGQVITGGTTVSMSSRRLPATWELINSKPLICGLPNGGTAVIDLPGRTALNATGDLRTVPVPDAIKQSLIDAGVTFRE